MVFRNEYFEPGLLDLTRANDAVALIESVVPDPTQVEVVISGDLPRTVRAWQPGYEGGRLVGTVEGKVVLKPSGGQCLILPCWSLLKVSPSWPETRHVAVHEAFHVATLQRDEQLDGPWACNSEDQRALLMAPIVA